MHAGVDGYKLSAPNDAGSPAMSDARPTVFVVDDDVSVRESLELLIRNEGWQAHLATAKPRCVSAWKA